LSTHEILTKGGLLLEKALVSGVHVEPPLVVM